MRASLAKNADNYPYFAEWTKGGQRWTNRLTVYVHAYGSDDGHVWLYRRVGGRLEVEEERQPVFCHVYSKAEVEVREPLSLLEEAVKTVPFIPSLAGLEARWDGRDVLKTVAAPSYKALRRLVEAHINDSDAAFFDLMPPLYRYCLEHGIRFFEGCDSPTILVFDVEALHPPGAFPKPERGEDKVVCVAAAYGRLGGPPEVRSFSLAEYGEEELLAAFEELVQEVDPDILATYSTFDVEFLLKRFGGLRVGFEGSSPELREAFIGRARKRGLRVLVPGRNYVDLLTLVMGHPQRREMESLRLKDVAAFFKVSHRRVRPIRPDEIAELWNKDPEIVETYCEDDAVEAYKLANVLLPVELQLCRMLLLPLDEVVVLSRYMLIHRLVSIKAHERGIAVPVLPRKAHEHYEGAISECYHRGLFERVVKIDVQSLYPNIMRQYGIKPDLGVLGDVYLEALDELTEERLRLKAKLKELDRGSPEYRRLDAHQQALKLLINSAYGQLGYAGGIFYSKERAAEVTERGREILRKVRGIVESRGCKVLEVDTDGLLLQVPEGERAERLIEEVNEALPPLIKVDLEGEWAYGLIHKAKNYILYNPGELIIKGSAFKGSRFRKFSRDVLKRAAEALFKSGGELEGVREVLAEARTRLEKGLFDPEEVCLRATLDRPLDAYKGLNTPHLAAAARLRDELGVEVGPGESVEYYIARGSGAKYLRSKPIQLYTPDDVDVDDVMKEAYRLVVRLVSAALNVDGKTALTMLMHGEVSPAAVRRDERPTAEKTGKKTVVLTKLPTPRLEEAEKGEADFVCLIMAPSLPLTVFNYGGTIKEEHPILSELPPGLKSYQVYSHVRALGRDIHIHLIDIDEPMSEQDYRRVVWKLMPLKTFSYKTTELPDGRFKAHIIVPVVFGGEYEEQRAIRRAIKSLAKALKIPDDPGNTATWTRMPLFMYDLTNFSTKHGQEMEWLSKPDSLEELVEAAYHNRVLLEDRIKSSLRHLKAAPRLKHLPPCIEKIVEDPAGWGRRLLGLEGYRHAVYVSLCWALSRYSGMAKEEAKTVALTFARALRYDETHTSTAEYQFEYCYKHPFAVDCDALEAAGLCDEQCPLRRWR